MKIEKKFATTGVAILTLNGKLNADCAQQIRSEFTRVVADGYPHVALDLTGVNFMDSSGVGALVAGLKATREAGGDLRIANPSSQVALVLELTRLNEIFVSYPNAETAFPMVAQRKEHTLILSTPPNNLDAVHDLMESVWESSPEIAPSDQIRFETALIELASNIFQHADNGSGISCTLTVGITSDHIEAQMRDTGEPGEIQLTGLVMPDDLSESGRGLVMIQALVDELTYEREGEHNVWRIKRKLDGRK